MGVVTADYETFYDKDYSLRKMSEVEYILDPRFQSIMCSVKEGDGPSDIFIGHKAIAARFERIDWSRNAFCAHNTRFDGSILAWHYGITPVMYLDTLSMARALTHAHIGRSSLDAISKYLGLPDKGTAVHNAIGMRLEDFGAAQLREYADYCLRDNDNCRAIFNAFMRVFPKPELKLIDIILRMFIEPQVLLDPQALALHLTNVRNEKAQVMARVAHIDKSVFSSNAKFAELLQSYGVDPPRKISPTTHQETWALAKNDRAFKELCDDDEQPLEVQAILAARVNSKSTLEETRTETLHRLSLREWPARVQSAMPGIDAETYGAARAHGLIPSRGPGWAPIPLKFYGAHTGRLSGDGGVNWQNPKRGSPIRGAACAPHGYRVVHRDASQIEARMVATLARCTKLLDAFRAGRDVYSEFASIVYRRRVTKADTKERFVGKTCILGLGYNTGGLKLRHTLFIGNGGISVKVEEQEASRIVWTYRDTYKEVPALWAKGDDTIRQMMHFAAPVTSGYKIYRNSITYPVVEAGPNALWLPNKLCIAYPKLRLESGFDATGRATREVVYDLARGGWTKLYGGKLTENVSQALARIIVTDIAVRVYDDLGYWPWLSTHDSLDYCVPEHEAKDFDARLDYEFSIAPSWLPDIPLASEGGWGVTLLKAEKAENL